jgi:hypothetical protein
MSGRAELLIGGDVAGETTARRLTGDARSHWRRWITWAALGCIVLAISLAFWVERYQPLTSSTGLIIDNSKTHFPGMPAGVRPRPVNTFGNLPGELYLPPQRGVMTVSVVLRNNGPLAVTIESVSIDPSLQLAGKPRYLDVIDSVGTMFSAVRGPVVWTSLRPGQTILVGIPIRVPDCVNKTTTPYMMTGSFQVRERLLMFSHTAAIPLPTPLIWLPGYTQATAGATCTN